MSIRNLKYGFAAALAAASLAATAAPTNGVYAGGALGDGHFPDTVNGVPAHDVGISGKLYGGYQFNPNFALEAGVAEFGRKDNAAGKISGHGEFLDAVGIAPLNDKWSLLGRIGAEHASLDTSNGKDNGNGIKVGFGAQYDVSSNVAVRAEWERYDPRVFGNHPHIDQYTVGVKVGF